MGDDFVVTSSSGASEYSWRISGRRGGYIPRHSLELVKQCVRKGRLGHRAKLALNRGP